MSMASLSLSLIGSELQIHLPPKYGVCRRLLSLFSPIEECISLVQIFLDSVSLFELVACRDYPHSRHLILFNKTHHSSFCEQILSGLSHSEMNMMNNFAATLGRRMNLRDLVSNASVYSGISDAAEGGVASLMIRRWATKKTAGSTKNGRDSNPKNLGVKKFGGERVIPGNIIVRQRGTRFHPGNYVGIGKDHTLFALKEGNVKFERNKLTGRKWVHVEPKEGHVLHPVYASNTCLVELKTAV